MYKCANKVLPIDYGEIFCISSVKIGKSDMIHGLHCFNF